MGAVSAHIKRFFGEYEEGANTFDVELNVRERNTVWLSAGPHGVVLAHNDASFPIKLKQRHQQLLAMGYRGARITALREIPLDDYYSLVKSAWRQTYQKDGRQIPAMARDMGILEWQRQTWIGI